MTFDDLDKIVILGVNTADLSVAPTRLTDTGGNGFDGLGLFARGTLEAFLVGRSLETGVLSGQISGVMAEESLPLA
jgi:hypothetical protein